MPATHTTSCSRANALYSHHADSRSNSVHKIICDCDCHPTYTDEAIVESFVGKTVRVITNRIGFEVELVGTLADLNGKGYYQVTVGDHNLFSTFGDGATISFNKGTVNAAWVAASGNIIRLDA